MKMRSRTIAFVAVAAFVFAGTVAAAAPVSVTVKTGTVTHGNAASLAATDGDTLDIVSVNVRGQRGAFKANYGSLSADRFAVTYLAWESGASPATCTFGEDGL
jgi:hypothetical protein